MQSSPRMQNYTGMTTLAGWSVTEPVLIFDLSSGFEDFVSLDQMTIISSTHFLVLSTRPGPVEPEWPTRTVHRW